MSKTYWDDMVSVVVSCFLFLLYIVYYYFDFIDYISKNETHIIWIYLSGYAKWIVKVILSLFTFYVLVLIIAMIILSVKTMFSNELSHIMEENVASSVEAEKTIQNKNHNIYLYYANSIAKFTIGTLIVPKFIIIFLVIIPIYLLIMTYFYKKICDADKQKISNHLVFHICLSVGVGFIILFIDMCHTHG